MNQFHFSSRLFIFSLAIFSISACTHSVPKTGYEGLGQESVSQEDLKKYAPPKLDNRVANKINIMLDILTPDAGIIHPNGKTLFFNWRISGNNQVWKINGPMGFPVQLTGGRDVTQLVDITPDGKFLILQRDIDGQENPGIYIQSTDGGALTKLYHENKVQAGFQFTSEDSEWIYFTANDNSPDSFTIYRININTKLKQLVFGENGTWSISDHKDDQLLLKKLTSSVNSEYYLYDQKTKKIEALIGQKSPEEYAVAFGAEKETYLVLTSQIGNFQRLYLLKNGETKLKSISPEIAFDISKFSIDRDRKRILYEVNAGGYTKLYALDARTFHKIKVPNFPNADQVLLGSSNSRVTTPRSSRSTMISVITSQTPRVSYSYDWSQQKLTQWTLPGVPEMDLKKFVPASLEYYLSKDNVKIPMFVRRPNECVKKTCPVVVLFHGGPEGQSYAGFNTLSQLFIDAGIIFVEPNVRGSLGYGKEWLNSDNGAKRLNVITDIQDVSIHIRKNWSYDGVQPKIGVMGWSYGGYSTLFAMTKFTGSFDSGVALVGMSNLLSFLNNTAPYRRKLRASEYGDPEKDKETLKELSPITYVDQVKSPLMIIQGANDPRVPAGEAIQIQKVLQAKNIKSELIIFPDEGHGTQKKENRILEWGHSLNFLMQTLK